MRQLRWDALEVANGSAVILERQLPEIAGIIDLAGELRWRISGVEIVSQILWRVEVAQGLG